MNGFKLGANDAISVVDKLSAVDLAFATSSEEIAVALQYVASSAGMAEVSLDKMVGLITTVSQTTRLSAETIGQSFKTIFARMQNVKIGEFIDPETGESLNDVEKVLNSLGIRLRDSETEWRSMETVIDEIGAKWSEFNDIEQSAITVALAGTRQRDKLIAAFENYDQVLAATTVSQNSAGTAAEKYEHVMDSIEAKIAQLTAKWEKFVNTLNQGDTFKWVIESGDFLIDILDRLVNQMGFVQNVFIPVSGAVTAIKLFTVLGEGAQKISYTIDSLKTFSSALNLVNQTSELTEASISTLGGMFTSLSESQMIAVLGSKNLQAAQMAEILAASGVTKETQALIIAKAQLAQKNAAAAASTNGLTKAMLAFKTASMGAKAGAVVAGIAIASMIVSFGVDAMNKKTQEMIDSAKELKEEFASTTESITRNISNISLISDEFKNLAKGVDDYGNNIYLTAEEFNRYKDIVADVVAMSPELSRGYSEENGHLIEKRTLLEDVVALQEKEYQQELKRATTLSAITGETALYAEELNSLVDSYGDIANSGYEDTIRRSLLDAFNVRNNELFGVNSEARMRNFAEEISKIIGVAFDPNNLGSYAAKNDGSFMFEEFFKDNKDLITENMSEITELLQSAQIDYSLMDGNSNYQPISNEDVTELNSLATSYSLYLKDLETIDVKAQEMVERMAFASTEYAKLPETTKQLIDVFASSFSKEDIMSQDWLGNWVQDDALILQAKTSVDQFMKAINSEVTSGNYQVIDLTEKLFSLDKSSMSVGEWRAQVESIIESIINSLNVDEPTGEKIKFDLKVQFGVTTVDENGNEQNPDQILINEVRKKFINISADELETLTESELRFAAKIQIDPEINYSDFDFEDLTNHIEENLKVMVDKMSTDFSSFSTEINRVADSLGILEGASQEYNETGVISAKTFESLSQNNLIQYLDFTSGSLVVLTDELYNAEQAAKAEAEMMVINSLATNLAALNAGTLKSEEDELEESFRISKQQAAELAPIIDSLGLSYLDTAVAAGILNDAIQGEPTGANRTEEYEKQRAALFEQTQRDIDAIRETGFGAFDGLGSSASAASSEVDGLRDSLSAIDDLLSDTMDMIEQGYENRIDNIQDEIDSLSDRYEKERDYLDDLKDAKDEEYEAERDHIDDLKDAENERYEEKRDNLEAEAEQIQTGYDKQIEALEKELDAYEEKINLQLEMLRLKEEEYEYDKQVEEQIGNISQIQDDLAALEFDNSIEAQKKKLELLEQLAEEEESLDDLQHDRDITLQEDALEAELERYQDLQNGKIEALEAEAEKQEEVYDDRLEQLENEHEAYIENLDNRLEALEEEKEAWDEWHEQKLEALENEYNANKEKLESQIKDIEDYTSRESNIRQEAIEMIEGRSEEFYQNLLLWNREYGTGIDADVTAKWNSAYSALEEFAGPNGTIRVQDALETISSRMYELENGAWDTARAFGQAAQEIGNAADALAYYDSIDPSSHGYGTDSSVGAPKIEKSHTGEAYVKKISSPLDESLGLNNDETLRILKVGEAVIPASENIRGLGIQGIRAGMSGQRPAGASSDDTTSESLSFSIGDIIIQGDADQSTVNALKKERENIVQEMFKRIEKHGKQSGFRNMKLFSV